MAKYRINDHAELSITADNVFDRKYSYLNAGANAKFYGEPRNVFANLRVRF
jgi:outer membrane receptor for ferric coprogen and ferric-rhodotorulic acid